MVIVAVAGGTGGVGKTVVEQLQLSCTKHKAFVLGRKVSLSQCRRHVEVDWHSIGNAQIPAEPLPETIKFLAVDYGDIDGLAKILEEHCIDTIISTLNLENEAGSQAQLNLIAASDRSRMTRRIIPSEFVPAIDEKYSSPSCIDRLDSGALTCDDSDPQTGPGVGGWIPNALALKKSNLEYIRISIGFFADYWGMPHIQSHLRPFYWGIDMANGKAVIPGSGNDKFTVTYSKDLARFIVRLLDEKEKWPERGYLAGSDISFNELLIIAENIRGKPLHLLPENLYSGEHRL